MPGSGFQIQSLAPTLPTVSQLPKGKSAFQLDFQVKQESKKKIKIPAYGDFQVFFQAGNSFEILDRDATDGIARVQVPTQVYDFYLRLSHPFSQAANCKGNNCSKQDAATLAIQDQLYQIEEITSPSKGQVWYQFAGRPLPIPTAWQNPYQQEYVLKFNNQGGNGFSTEWYKNTTGPKTPPLNIAPRVDCFHPNRNGTFTAYLGYTNPISSEITLPIGSDNKFEPGEENRGQPITFATGNSPVFPNNQFSVVFEEPILHWHLNNQIITIDTSNTANYCNRLSNLNITVPPDVAIRKSFLPSETITITEGNSATQTLEFELNETPDIMRRFLLNMTNGASPVSDVQVKINGQNFDGLLHEELESNLIQLFGIHAGTNTLEITLTGEMGDSVTVFLDGFMEPVYVPGAVHSLLPDDEVVRIMPYIKGKIGIKFIEGLDIRLDSSGSIAQFYDESGFSLQSLNEFLRSNGISEIAAPIAIAPTQLLNMTNQAQNSAGREFPSLNLFYSTYLDENVDLWPIIDNLRKNPLIEEAFPEFQVKTASTPTDPQLLPNSLITEEFQTRPIRPSQWLQNTRIMTGKQITEYIPPSPEPSLPVKPGAWEYTTGIPQVRIALLDDAAQHEKHDALLGIQTHEEFKDINGNLAPNFVPITNVDLPNVPKPYTDLNHGTFTTSIVGAVANNNKGLAGVAHNATIMPVMYQFSKSITGEEIKNPSGCKYNKSRSGDQFNSHCDPILDSIFLAQESGANVFMINGWVDPFTVEQAQLLVRAAISILTHTEGIPFIVPAGNFACQDFSKEVHKSKCEEAYYGTKITSNGRTIFSGRDIAFIPRPLDQTNSFYPFIQEDFPVVADSFQLPMFDTGSIIVGALTLYGDKKLETFINPTTAVGINYGKTDPALLPRQHGIDISAPGTSLWAAGYPPCVRIVVV